MDRPTCPSAEAGLNSAEGEPFGLRAEGVHFPLRPKEACFHSEAAVDSPRYHSVDTANPEVGPAS